MVPLWKSTAPWENLGCVGRAMGSAALGALLESAVQRVLLARRIGQLGARTPLLRGRTFPPRRLFHARQSPVRRYPVTVTDRY